MRLFRSKRGDYLKILYWDGSGLCLFANRLEPGRFVWPPIVDGALVLTPAQLALLVEAIDWRRTRGRGIDLTEVSHLATALAIRYCNRIPSFGDIDPHERFATLAHGSSSWAEARLGPSEQPSPSPA